jgi:FdhD protein
MGVADRRTNTTAATVVRVQGESHRSMRDWLATEEPLEIRLVPHGSGLPGRPVSITMRTPGNDFELAAGFLFTEGILPGRQAIRRITYCVSEADGSQQYNIVNVFLRPGFDFDPQLLQRNFYMSSSCGVCGKGSLESLRVRMPEVAAQDLAVSPAVIRSLPDRLRAAQAVFARTGGLHAAALFDVGGAVTLLREDVGRHNAVDKLIGHGILHGLGLGRQILMVSGRTSFEIMQKAAAASLPMVVAISAPSSLAVDLARSFGMTLVGFLREGRFNVYAGSERIEGAIS